MVNLQVENGFILLLEKEIFIDQLKDIVDKAEDMLNEDIEGERASTLSCSPQQGQMSEGLVGEVRLGACSTHAYTILFRLINTNKLIYVTCVTMQSQQPGAPQPVYQQNGKNYHHLHIY